MQYLYFQDPNLLAVAGLSSFEPEESKQCVQDSPIFDENDLKNIEIYYKDDCSTTKFTSQTHKGKNKSSKFHNKLTQTVTTYKQILDPYYKELGSTKISRKIISVVWERYTKRANPSKRSLKLMLNNSPDLASFQKDRLLLKEENFSQQQLTTAMSELKQGIIYYCSMVNVRLNLTQRQKIADKNILEAYIQRFYNVQLKGGNITQRFGQKGADMISLIMKSERKDVDFVSAVMF